MRRAKPMMSLLQRHLPCARRSCCAPAKIQCQQEQTCLYFAASVLQTCDPVCSLIAILTRLYKGARMTAVNLPLPKHTAPRLSSTHTVRWPAPPAPSKPCTLHRERILSCRAASTSNTSSSQSKDGGDKAEAFSRAAGRRYRLAVQSWANGILHLSQKSFIRPEVFSKLSCEEKDGTGCT
jgi:hypothetical protein